MSSLEGNPEHFRSPQHAGGGRSPRSKRQEAITTGFPVTAARAYLGSASTHEVGAPWGRWRWHGDN